MPEDRPAQRALLAAHQDQHEHELPAETGDQAENEPRLRAVDLTHDEMVRLYGPWAGRTPRDVADLFVGYAGPWWVAGGWALEAFTGVARDHEDCDPSVLRDDLPQLRRHLAGRLDLWAASSGSLWPVLADDRADATADEILPEGCGQLWARRSAVDPWEFDILLAPGDADTWVYKRDPRLRLPLADACWERDGVHYLQPEIQLLYKARGLRAKDRADFDATLPFLDRARRRWLLDALRATLPGHQWVDTLAVAPAP